MSVQVGAAGAAEDHARVRVARPSARRRAAVAPVGGGLRLGDHLPHRGGCIFMLGFRVDHSGTHSE
jgi:hypothetical protein